MTLIIEPVLILLPEMTYAFEINVPPQKNLGGLVPVCIKATIHGNAPRVIFSPRKISPKLLFGTPQVSVLLLDRLRVTTEDDVTIAHKANAIKVFLIIVSTFVLQQLVSFVSTSPMLKTSGFALFANTLMNYDFNPSSILTKKY